jgi:plasmid maintenance system killer protein
MKIKKSIPLLLIVFLTSIHVDLLASDKGTYVSIENTETSENVNKTDENDPRAVAIANKVMDAMGGTKAWNNARHLHWNFFGARTLVWDKWTGDVRIDVPAEKATYLLNINTMQGKAMVKGTKITDAAELEKALEKAKSIWINDSYWLVMPFKLQDPGVTLTYEGEKATETGAMSDVLGLTFENVGLTPQNKYSVYVDKESHLVNQWAFYRDTTDEKPGFVLPWGEYKSYDKLMLSGDRGERDLTDIKVFRKLPKSVYESFEKPTL